jgi:hypothetical protein
MLFHILLVLPLPAGDLLELLPEVAFDLYSAGFKSLLVLAVATLAGIEDFFDS